MPAPPTRVVFLVAKDGKPRPCAASLAVPFTPTTGWLPVSSLLPQPARKTVPSAAMSRGRTRIADDSSGRSRTLRHLVSAPQVSPKNRILIEVDRGLCFGFGDCVATLPDVFDLDDEDKD